PNKDGRIATTLEWAKRLTADDIKLLRGQAPYGEKVPDPDEGFTQADLKDAKKAEAVYKVIQQRLTRYQKERPGGYLVREAPADDVKPLKLLSGHVRGGRFLTRLGQASTSGELEDAAVTVTAGAGSASAASSSVLHGHVR